MLRQRSISAIFIVVAAVVPAILGHPILTIAVAALVILGMLELMRALIGASPTTRIVGPPVIVGTITVLAVGFDAAVFAIAATVSLGMLAVLATRIGTGPVEQSVSHMTSSVLAIFYVAIPLAHLPTIRNFSDHDPAGWVISINNWSPFDNPASGLAWLVLIVAITWLTDTAAYLGGRTFGRHRLAPVLSPGKTIEGAISGVVFGMLSGVVFATILGIPIPLYVAAAIGLVLSIVGQIGDLVESLIKRDLGIKDMGDVIPGHGGILDRIDALLFTLPAGYYLIRLILEVNWP